jgi:hypothetical protein
MERQSSAANASVPIAHVFRRLSRYKLGQPDLSSARAIAARKSNDTPRMAADIDRPALSVNVISVGVQSGRNIAA